MCLETNPANCLNLSVLTPLLFSILCYVCKISKGTKKNNAKPHYCRIFLFVVHCEIIKVCIGRNHVTAMIPMIFFFEKGVVMFFCLFLQIRFSLKIVSKWL